METYGDVWHVRLASGDVRAMSLDQLDEAFQAGLVNEGTFVCKEGTATWATLGEVAGLGPQEPAPMSAPPPAVVSEIADFEIEPNFRGRSKKGLVLGIAAAVMVLGAAAFGVTKFGGAPAADTTAAAAGPAVPQNVAPPVAPAPPPAPKADVPDTSKPALTDLQKKNLLEQDKARQAAAAARKARTPAPAPRRAKSSDPFIKGGNKYDPLNAKL